MNITDYTNEYLVNKDLHILHKWYCKEMRIGNEIKADKILKLSSKISKHYIKQCERGIVGRWLEKYLGI